MKKRNGYLLILGLIGLICAISVILLPKVSEPKEFVTVDKDIAIKPDYTGITIPLNIAPLNFVVLEPGREYFVKIHSVNGKPINIPGNRNKIIIPLRKWKTLLEANRGEKLFFEIYINNGQWKKYRLIENYIAEENIDSFIAYRRIEPVCSVWGQIGIYQRNLENFSESLIVHGKTFANDCVNCHSFAGNNPETMLIGIRSSKYGGSAICVRNGSIEKIDSIFGYTALHPSGRLIAYAFIKVRQFFHSTGMEIRDVVDLDSTIAYYNLSSKTIKTAPNVSEKNRLETYPAWTPDGKYLYFCSAPIPWQDRNKLPPEHYEQVKYVLRRISYDVETDQWGQPETVLSADKTGLSILEPRVSPDGRFLLFCMCNYGCFPVYQPSSDLYLMDLKTGDYRKLAINSEYSESWHSWSSNSRWIAFSSKRRGGLFTRTYISFVDEQGNVHKPFIMPQKDPEFYDSFLETYSVPELITGPVRVDYKAIGRVVRSVEGIKIDIPYTTATPVAGSEKLHPRHNERE
ncbi:MAG: PD40 domain-containing protein [Sedimentisphaerales bacterium]|nr:PD40 domain-containing protein [Sedimentisphaerales bacterium]